MTDNTRPEVEPSDLSGETEPDFFQREIWARLGAAPSVEAFAGAWLELQCRQIAEVRAAVVLLTPEGASQLSPAAIRPEDAALSTALVTATERAASDLRAVVRPRRSDEIGGDSCALPVLVDGALRGVVALELRRGARVDVRRVMRQLQWGSGWLEVLIRRRHPGEREQLVSVLDLLAAALEQPRFQTAANALANELAQRLNCDRVSLGLNKGAHARVRAVSNSVSFSQKSGEVRAIASAMDEAIEQAATVRVPSASSGLVVACRSHEALSEAAGVEAVMSVPLHEDGRCLGAITLERRQGSFSEKEVALIEHICALVGPALEAKRLNDRWLPRKAWDSGGDALKALVGPRHVALKLGAAATAAGIGFLVLATGPYRVASDASLQGTVRRVVVSPIQGFVDEANARAGDVVAAGSRMARLDDDELTLEQVRLLSEKAQLEQKYKAAFAAHKPSEARIVRAQIEGVEARLNLVAEQLRRTEILAPFDGLVTNGDLSQSLGSPVTRGEVLFEIAPLDSYRVVVLVDERDISRVAVGQSGRLVLSAMPDDAFPFKVSGITPVAQSQEGVNRFKVEALLDEVDPRMRPGMEGVAKIEIGERRLIWIWTHKFWWWLRLKSWTWWPHA